MREWPFSVRSGTRKANFEGGPEDTVKEGCIGHTPMLRSDFAQRICKGPDHESGLFLFSTYGIHATKGDF